MMHEVRGRGAEVLETRYINWFTHANLYYLSNLNDSVNKSAEIVFDQGSLNVSVHVER